MILACDPGGKSGIALRMPDGSFETFICESLFDNNTRYDASQLYDALSIDGLTQIVVENFVAQTISRFGLHTVRLVGAVEAIGNYRKIPVKIHMPQDRYPFLTDAKSMLRKRGISFMVHEQDALAHLLRWEFDNAKS